MQLYRKLFKRLILVQTLSILSTTVSVIVDSSITSMFLGEAALSAAGMSMPLILVVATIGGSVAVGFQTVVARKLGRGDREGASSLFNYILILALILSLAVVAIIFMFSSPLAIMLGATRGSYLYTQIIGYLKGFAIGVPAYSIMLLLTPVMFIDADKDRVTAATIVMVVVDIVLDLMNVFIFKQEMFGMAVASSLSYLAAMVILLLHFKRKETSISLDLRSAKPIEISAILKNSSTYTIYHICKAALTFAVNRLLIAFGVPEEVAVYAAISSLTLMLTSPGSAMGSVTLSLSSLFHGENDISREDQLRKAFSLYSLIICGVITVIMVAFASPISSFFIKADSPHFDSCVIGLRLLALSLVLNSINNCYRNYYQGVGRLASSLTVCILQYFAAPVCSLFAILTASTGPQKWLFFITAEVITFIVAMLLKGKDKGKELFDREILIDSPERSAAAIEAFRELLPDSEIAGRKFSVLSTVLKGASDLFAGEKQPDTEMNIRAYETGDVLKCSIETNLSDPDGKLKQAAPKDQDDISYSEVFGLKRIILEDLRSD